jgi:hypothetical protein
MRGVVGWGENPWFSLNISETVKDDGEEYKNVHS